MAELMLVNPRRRRRRVKAKSKRVKKRRRMSALQKKFFGKKRTKRNPIVMAKKSRRRHRTFIAKRRYKRNPSGGFSTKNFMGNTLMPSAIGAAGALGIDVIMGYLPIPVQFKTGPMRAVVKVAGAAAIGFAASKFMKRETANQIAAGAITVAMYDVFKGFLQQAMPTIPLSENDALIEEYPSLAYAGAGYTVDGMNDINEYVSDEDGSVGMYVGDQS